MFDEIIKKLEWNNDTLELSTGKFARQADGAVMIKKGGSAVLCTAVGAKEEKEGIGFFPLTVNYQEKSYAAGKIPGGFLKRETGRSEKETLVSRLIDRPIRPLFHPGFLNETQVLCNVHSLGSKGNTDILALIGASAALAISGLPITKIVAASRVGLIDNEFILNPTLEQLKESKLDLIVAGTKDSVMMVESEADFLSEDQMLDAIKFGHKSFQPVIKLIEKLREEVGKPVLVTTDPFPSDLKEEIVKLIKSDIESAFTIQDKKERSAAVNKITIKMQDHFAEDERYTVSQINFVVSEVKSDILRSKTLLTEKRIDGRSADQIRPIYCDISLFEGTHGSANFTRGETQVLAMTTLGTVQDQQIMDGIDGEYKERFMLNYIFPGYSVGEVAYMRAPSRREIGHGKLAWRALKNSLPKEQLFPYTIRVVAEVTACNGSSSMATICSSSMSMMNAGVPLKSPVSGIAMGLIKEGDEYIILSDIIADEDALGDMDFKVAGGSEGITALQMDIKVDGISFEIMKKAMAQAKNGRVYILDEMSKTIDKVAKVSGNAPMIESFMINKDKIREVIGAGGKVIREICDTTGAKIDITDDGQVSVAAVGREKLDAAIDWIKSIAIDPKVGDMFDGKVVKVLDAGAFVNYTPNRDGFVHISEISSDRVETVASVLSVGQKVKVKLIGFDRGKAKLTIKNADNAGIAEDNNKTKDYSNSNAKKKPKDKRESSKKWNNSAKDLVEDKDNKENSSERKYFN